MKIKSEPEIKNKTIKNKTKVNFGFYNFIVVWSIILILILRLLYFTQDAITERLPVAEIYLNYLFESIRNIKDIIQNFITN